MVGTAVISTVLVVGIVLVIGIVLVVEWTNEACLELVREQLHRLWDVE